MDKKKRRIRQVVIAIAIITVSGGLITVLNLGQVFAEEILGELVQRQTKGYYQLNFNEIQVDLLEREIQVKQLYLQADSSKISKETNLNTVYEIQLSNLIINLKSLFKFYFQKKLEIESMRIVDPEIRMQRIGEQTSTSFSFETGNLYKAISDYLTVLKVDYFRIQDGDLKYNSDQFSVGNIDFQIQNLLLDSVVRNDVFYSETIFLEVQNQKYFLPDSIHEIEFDRFVLSTKDSILRFENLSIHPTKESGVRFEDENNVNVYDIQLPVLALKGIDYQSAYRKDHLIIDGLSFIKPAIFVDNETHGKAKKDKSDNSLLNLLFTVFHKIEIGKFSIEDSEIDLKINNDQTYQRIKSEETSIVFYDIILDSSNYLFDQRTRYFENVEISVQNYDYILPDSIHEVRFDALKISSKDSLLSIRNLEIAGTQNSKHKPLIDLKVPSIDLFGFAYDNMIAKRLTVRDLLIDRIYFQFNGSKEKSKNEKRDAAIASVYQSIAPIFTEIDIGQFTIGKAELKLHNGISIGAATLDLEGLALNASTRSVKDLFELSYISLRDINIQQDSIQIIGNEATLSHDLTEIELADWDLFIHSGEMDIAGEFQSLRVVDLNPDSLLHGNFMTFRKAFVESPKFNVAKSESPNHKEKKSLGIEKEILITDGHFTLDLDSIAASVESIDVDFYLGDSIAIHDINARKIVSSLPKQNHELNLGQFLYDTLKDEMHFVDIQVNPINRTDSSQSLLTAAIPEIKIDGFIQDQFFNQNELIAQQLTIDNPNIELFQVKNKNQQKPNSNFKASIATTILNSGEFAISGISEEIKEIIISDLNSKIAKLNYPTSNSLFYSDSLFVEISSILPDFASGDQASIGNFTFNSVANSLSIDSIFFQKANKSLELIIPNTSIGNLAIKKLIDDGEIIASEMSLNDPNIYLVRTEKVNSIIPKKNPSILMNLDELNFNNISVSYQDTLNKKSYEINGATLNLMGINHAGQLDFMSILQNTDDFSLSGNHLDIPIDQFYSLKAASYSYDSKAQKLAFSNIHFNPLYSKTDYTKFLEEQKDWFDASSEEVVLQGVDVVEIVNDSLIKVESVSLDRGNLFIYRDKKLPFPKDQVGKLPTEQILNIPYPTQVDTISIKGHVAYEEQPNDFEQTGIITFDDIDAQIFNLTNFDIQPHTIMQLNATGSIVEEGSFNVNVKFELDKRDQRFSFTGIVKDLPLDSLNQMLGPVARINIKDGFAEEIKFQFLANDSLASGEMTFLYKDLKLQVLNTKKHESNLKSGLMSFFANTFVIHKKNPRFLFPRKGTIYHKRDTSKAIFNYWGKSILSGAVSSVGIHKSDRQERRDSKAAKKGE